MTTHPGPLLPYIQQSRTWAVRDLTKLDLITSWAMNIDNHSQLIHNKLGDSESWAVVVTDVKEPEMFATDRCGDFVLEFGSAVEEILDDTE